MTVIISKTVILNNRTYSNCYNINQINMNFVEQTSEDYSQRQQQKSKYSKTSIKKKYQLVDLVVNHHYTIYKASKKLKMSYSTSKEILMNYERFGTILQRNTTKNRSNLQSLEINLQQKIQIQAPNIRQSLQTNNSDGFNEKQEQNGQNQLQNMNMSIPISFNQYPFPIYYWVMQQ